MKLLQLVLPLAFMGSVSAIVLPPPPEEVDAGMIGAEEESDSYGLNTSFENVSLNQGPPANYIAPPPPEETDSAWKSFLGAGYASHYDYEGMVAGNILCKEGVMTLKGGTEYILSNGMALAGTLDYAEIFSGFLKDDDQARMKLSLKDELFPNLYVDYGYRLIHGGIPGVYAKARGASHSLSQQFDFSARYDFVPEGYFAGFNISYAFQGITGWWFGAYAGYQYDFDDHFSAVFTTSISASSSYWETGGMNQVSFNVDLPYTIADEWTIGPFVSFHWLGKPGLKMNSLAGERVMRPFTVMAGVNVTWEF